MFFSGFVAVGVELCCEHTALLNCKALTPWAGVPGQELGLSTVFQRCRSREEGVGCWDVMFHMALWWHKMGLFAAWFSLMHVKSPSLTLAVPGMDYLGSVAELLNLAMSLPIMWVRRHQLLSCLLWNICSNWEFTQQPAAKKSSSSCIALTWALGNPSHRGSRQTQLYQQRFMVDKVHKGCLHLKVGLIRKSQELCRKPYPSVLVSQGWGMYSSTDITG